MNPYESEDNPVARIPRSRPPRVVRPIPPICLLVVKLIYVFSPGGSPQVGPCESSGKGSRSRACARVVTTGDD